MKTLIQIGLHESCEYIYVTEPNWTDLRDENNTPGCPFIPAELWNDGSPWNYYGVDMNEGFIENLKEEFGDRTHVHLLHALIHEKEKEKLNHNGWVVGEGDTILEATSLDSLINKTGYPNALIMDVENSEFLILRGYSWRHKPDFISVETHSIDSTSGIIELLINQGYYLIDWHQGAAYTNRVINLSFIRKDITSEETKGLWAYRCNL